MKFQSSKDRQRIAMVCCSVLVGLLPLSGCGFSRSLGDSLPAWMRWSSPAPASTPRNEPAQAAAVARPPAGAAAPAGLDRPAAGASSPQFAGPSTAAWPESSRVAAPVRLTGAEIRPASSPVARGVVHADDRSFDEQVLRSDVPVLVDFYAPWCGPCKRLAPALDELAAESPRARVVKVDIDDSPAVASRYGVQSVPCLLVFKNGQIVARQTGVVSKDRLKNMLDL